MTKIDTQRVRNLLHALDKMATLYLDKTIACNASIPAYEAKQEKVWNDFYHACQTGDYKRIAELFPYSDGVLEIEIEDLSEEDQLAMRAKALREIFQDAESLHPNNVRAIIGTDPEIGFRPEMIYANKRRREIFMSIWNDTQTMLAKLEQALPAPRRASHFDITDLFKPSIPRDVTP